MAGRTLAALAVLLTSQLMSGCCWMAHRPFLCCRQRFFAPVCEPCTTSYPPAGLTVAPPVYPTAPTYQTVPSAGIPIMRSAPIAPAQPTPPPTNGTPGTIPSFPASAGRFTNAPVR
jgi:hypothetical protein